MTAGAAIRVVLCDDHVMVREGLRRVIDGVEGIEVVASASDGEEGIEATLRLRPDVVLMDLAMPGRRRRRGHAAGSPPRPRT